MLPAEASDDPARGCAVLPIWRAGVPPCAVMCLWGLTSTAWSDEGRYAPLRVPRTRVRNSHWCCSLTHGTRRRNGDATFVS